MLRRNAHNLLIACLALIISATTACTNNSVKSESMYGKKAEIPSTSTIDENNRIVDKIDYPFINDLEALGTWKSVDFIENIGDFKPGTKNFKGDLYLKEMLILENGKTGGPWNWTKGLILHPGDKTAAKYLIKEITDFI